MESSNEFEESIPFSNTNEDLESELYLETSETDGSSPRSIHPPHKPSGYKRFLLFVLSFIAGAVMSITFNSRPTPSKMKANLDHECATHTSEYCEYFDTPMSPDFIDSWSHQTK